MSSKAHMVPTSRFSSYSVLNPTQEVCHSISTKVISLLKIIVCLLGTSSKQQPYSIRSCKDRIPGSIKEFQWVASLEENLFLPKNLENYCLILSQIDQWSEEISLAWTIQVRATVLLNNLIQNSYCHRG
uniref:Uncharacterized protein n=1 Tax=Sphaerodactylus townsendi TaxID=933632 RepID=A0ACB8E6Z6_9SAUR